MAMTPEKMIAFFEQQAELFAGAAASATSSGDGYLAATTLQETFKSRLMVGLLQWRHRFQNPTAALLGAIGGADDTASALRAIGPQPAWSSFQFETVELLKGLLNKEPDLPLMQAMVDASAQDPPELAERFLDAAIALALANREIPPVWNSLLDRLRQNKRAKLAVETYESYGDLLRAGLSSRVDDMLSAIDRAALAFLRRKGDSFFSGGSQTQGGGPDNDHVVDYRLGVLMKSFLLPDLTDQLTTQSRIHRWEW